MQAQNYQKVLLFSFWCFLNVVIMCDTVLWFDGRAHLVTECGVIERVQFVGDIFANEVSEHLIEESVWLQEIGEPLSRPAQEFTVLLCRDGHLLVNHNIYKGTSHWGVFQVIWGKVFYHKTVEVSNQTLGPSARSMELTEQVNPVWNLWFVLNSCYINFSFEY